MESEAGLKAIKEMIQHGTPVEIIEGDGDNTLVARLEKNMGLTVKKSLTGITALKKLSNTCMFYATNRKSRYKQSSNSTSP